MKKILVAGGAGYIGSRLVPFLTEAGHEVVVVDLMWFGNHLPSSVPVLARDIFQLSEDDIRGFDTVIFIAGLSNDPMADFSPALNYISNSAGAAYLAHIARKAGAKRYIYGSSCSVYGLANQTVVDETAVPNSKFAYGAAKLGGEFSSLQLADDTFSVIALRQGTVSGGSPRMRFDLLFNTMFMKVKTEQKIIVNNPAIWRPFLGIEDAVRAYKTALDASESVSGIFNVASGNIQIGDAAEAVKTYFGTHHGIDVAIETKTIPDVRNYQVSAEKIKRELGATFSGTVESILEDLDRWVSPNTDFSSPEFYNIRVFEALPKHLTFE